MAVEVAAVITLGLVLKEGLLHLPVAELLHIYMVAKADQVPVVVD
jgi:hypothetical protein